MAHGRLTAHLPGPAATVRQERTRGRVWTAIRRAVLSRNPLCTHCQRNGRYTPAEEVDHVVPLAHGGTDDWSNLQSLCRDCHRIKSAREAGKQPMRRIGVDGWPIDDNAGRESMRGR